MKRIICLILLILHLFPLAAIAGDNAIHSAEIAAPNDLASRATIVDWNNKVLREGTNDWVCFIDNPATPDKDPMCLDKPWMNWAKAYMSKTKPSYDSIGVGYMFQGEGPTSNTDPYASSKTSDEDWVPGVPHIMILAPNVSEFKGLPTRWQDGGPWIMWKGTPYEHLMIPIESMKK
ncbi:MAG: hypothetical protein OEZ51_09445 [Nitrospinota bacterium]|nr:hypothetical protein [Nitrospinota bacterium]